MAPKSKATTEQKEYLLAHVDGFREVQKQGSFPKFWARVFAGWFSCWPENGDTTILDEELCRKTLKTQIDEQEKYIRTWYRNHAILKIRSRGGQAVKPPKAKRAPQLLELYQNQYYKAKIAADVSKEVQTNKPGEEGTLNTIRSKTSDAWLNEDPAVKERVTQEHQRIQKEFRQAREEQKRLEKAKAKEPATPNSYASRIKDIYAHFGAFTQAAAPASGWSFVLLAGGPDPSNGGCINTVAFHHASNIFGMNFSQHEPEFTDWCVPAFNKFLYMCYSPEQCANRALDHSPATPSPPLGAGEAETTPKEATPSTSSARAQKAKTASNEATLPLVTSPALSTPFALPSSVDVPPVPANDPLAAVLAELPLSSPVPAISASMPPAVTLPQLPLEEDFDWESFAHFGPYPGMHDPPPGPGGYASLLEDMPPLPTDVCSGTSQGFILPTPSFTLPEMAMLPNSQPLDGLLSWPFPSTTPGIGVPLYDTGTPTLHEAAATTTNNPIAVIATMATNDLNATAVTVNPTVGTTTNDLNATAVTANSIVGTTTNDLNTTAVTATNTTVSTGSKATTDVLSGVAPNGTKPPANRKRRSDGTDEAFIVTTKRCRKLQSRTEIEPVTKKLIEEKENQARARRKRGYAM